MFNKKLQRHLKHVKFVLRKRSSSTHDKGWDPLKIHFISPERVSYVTPVTPYVDYVRHKTHGIDHPHSGNNRGSFKKKHVGRIYCKDWDLKSLKFNDLIVFISLRDYLTGEEVWENTPFAQRTIKWIESGNMYRDFSTVRDYLKHYPLRIQRLSGSIEKKGVKRITFSRFDRKIFDEITVNIGRDNDIFFNNRGHHRLSIAKIIGCEKVPVLINTRYNDFVTFS